MTLPDSTVFSFNAKKLKKNQDIKYIKYSFSFISFITPYKITNIRLLNQNNIPDTLNQKQKKLFVKQSYLLMTWIWYLKQKYNSVSKPSFIFKPTKVTKYTLLKSPMAHKTFSQEQFQFKFYSLLITFYIPWTYPNSFLKVNQILYLLLNLKNNIPFFETNFLILQRFQLRIPSSDKKYWIL